MDAPTASGGPDFNFENVGDFAGFVTEIVTEIGENAKKSPKFSHF